MRWEWKPAEYKWIRRFKGKGMPMFGSSTNEMCIHLIWLVFIKWLVTLWLLMNTECRPKKHIFLYSKWWWRSGWRVTEGPFKEWAFKWRNNDWEPWSGLPRPSCAHRSPAPPKGYNSRALRGAGDAAFLTSSQKMPMIWWLLDHTLSSKVWPMVFIWGQFWPLPLQGTSGNV